MLRRPAGCRKATVAVEKQRACDLGKARVQGGKDEQLVPEDVPAICLTVQAPGRDTDVGVDAVQGQGLQQVELVQSQGERVDGGVSTRVGCDGAGTAPQVVPRPGVRVAQVREVTCLLECRDGGVSWLGPSLITPAVMIAYIWVWAGFAMVVIAAGLSAISREVLEAARTDGATEWQVFRRITVPMLAPVLSVVFVTMLINVLKVFDIVLSVAPGSSQDDANVIALAMWRTSFGGVNDFGLGSAIATFLFLLVIPALLLNVRRFKRES